MKVHVADNTTLGRALMRSKSKGKKRLKGVNLDEVLSEILTWADRFVPSESGSILLDDPFLKREPDMDGKLYFVACYGSNSETLAGTDILSTHGIVGETYSSGTPYISEDTSQDDKFEQGTDKKTSYQTLSIICAPIVIGGSVIGVIELINRKGHKNYATNDLTLLEIFAGYTANLVEKSLAARDFEELSKRDNLTGLFNDRYFLMRLEQEVELKGETSLIFFDLDRFKEVNDNHGHIAGSTVLKEVGDVMREVFDESETAMARYGGDEFAIILPATTLARGTELAENLCKAIQDKVFLDKPGPRGEDPIRLGGIVTASVGVATRIMEDGAEEPFLMAEDLLKAADDSMYTAKGMGKNRVWVEGQK
jgi:diguanylate cyclase (GGDEF)-like protein